MEASLGFTGTWRVVHFGAGGRDRAALGNRLKDALIALAWDLREIPVAQEIQEISDHDVGDAGIDIILYKEWADLARGIPSYFAQCAAQQKDWPTKKYEANALNLEKYLSFFHKPGTILFIPLCFSGCGRKWVDSSGHQTTLVDRKRLLELIDARIAGGEDEYRVFGRIPQPFPLGCFGNTG